MPTTCQPPSPNTVSWRSARLRAAGFTGALADRLARDPGYDLHALLTLTDRGCPPDLAARIVAPLEPTGPAVMTPRTHHTPPRAGITPAREAGTPATTEDANGLEVPPEEHLAGRGPDAVSRAWVQRLRPHHPDRAAAVADLHALLVSAARFEIHRRRATTPHLRGGDHADLAQQCADDALVAVLAKLDDYRGASRFTTWAYKFALLEAAVTIRRRSWQSREIPVVAERWPTVAAAGSVQADVETREMLAAVGRVVEHALTRHQREVLLALTVHEVPIDVLAERLGSTRGALYKTLHDARRKLRATLAAEGTLPAHVPDGAAR